MASISEIFEIAVRYHQGGQLRAAEQIYRQVLAAEPNQPHAIHLLGVIAHQSGKPNVAVDYIARAIQLQDSVASFHNNLGEAYRASRRIPEAVGCYRRAILLKPDFAEAHYNLGNALRQQNKLDEAIACFRRAVQMKPDYGEAHGSLGNALKEQGKLEEAIACYHRALELKPDFAPTHNNLGMALRDLGKLDQAIDCWRRALELDPDYVGALSNLGMALRDQGKPEEAAACHRRARESKPEIAEVHANLGNALKDLGKLDETVACYRRALELKPDFAEAHNNLGLALKEQMKLDEAIACYRQALELMPNYAEAYNNLGVALGQQGRPDEALACFRRALKLRPDSAEVHCMVGNAQKDQGKLDEALASLRRAVELKPELAEAHGNLGGALAEAGDLQGAEESFRTAVRHNPRFAFAHGKLAELLGGKLSENEIAAQRLLLEQSALTSLEQVLLHFGLAKVVDARGEYAEAAAHLERANALQLCERSMRGEVYGPNDFALHVSHIMAVCTPDFFERVRGFGLESELPVFVIGLPRSGTTLVEQILASHSQVFGGGELRLAHETMAALGAKSAEAVDGLGRLDGRTALDLASRHLGKLRTLHPTALRIVDKMPDNYLLLGLLATLFPRAKFIHCRRDLRDVAVSCWMTHFREIRWANDQEHIASRFNEYQRIMKHWRKVLPAPLLEVDYEETVTDLQSVAQRLVAWCGLPWEPGCLEFHRTRRPVRTASAVQVRQPLYETSVGRWRNYENALTALFGRLEMIERSGEGVERGSEVGVSGRRPRQR